MKKLRPPTSTWTGFCTLHLIHQMAYSGQGVSLKLSKSANADFTNQRRFVSCRVVFTYPKIQRLKLCTQGSSRYIYIHIESLLLLLLLLSEYYYYITILITTIIILLSLSCYIPLMVTNPWKFPSTPRPSPIFTICHHLPPGGTVTGELGQSQGIHGIQKLQGQLLGTSQSQHRHCLDLMDLMG